MNKNNRNIFTYILFIIVIVMAVFRYFNFNERVNITNDDLTLDTYKLISYEEQEDYIYLSFNDAIIGVID